MDYKSLTKQVTKTILYMDMMKMLVISLLISTGACKKDNDKIVEPENIKTEELVQGEALEEADVKEKIDLDINVTDYNPLEGFIQYIIPKGAQGSLQSSFKAVKYDSLVFEVYFDSSAIYTTTDKANQGDINKLYGFSDCSSLHQTNSARFGWRYYKSGLELFAYTYAGGTRSFKTLGSIQVNKKYTCTIVAKANKYVFYLNGESAVEMNRGCSGSGIQYQLYPYFGGDENAPQNINIWIKDVN